MPKFADAMLDFRILIREKADLIEPKILVFPSPATTAPGP
jgi:hypothetical protein